MPGPEYLADLIFRHLQGKLNASESLELEKWRHAAPENERLLEEVSDPGKLLEQLRQHEARQRKVWGKIVALAPELAAADEDRSLLFKKPWWKKPLPAAAMIIVIAGILFVWLAKKNPAALPPKTIAQTTTATTDISPGTNKAILVLSDGSQLTLDSTRKRIAVPGANVQNEANTLSYATETGATATTYNTLSTPRGGQYQIILPDGTHAWLNAASSLKYPTRFEGDTRKVNLTGEAYFEVAKDPAHPFIVRINDKAEVTVMGTHFNIMAYPEESKVLTSLLEGAVRFQQETLSPGQQGQLSPDGSIHIKPFNEKEVLGWKTGMIQLTNTEVASILRVVSRWYDVDVVYKGKIPGQKMTGGLLRNAPLSEIIKILNVYDIHCRIEGKQLIVE